LLLRIFTVSVIQQVDLTELKVSPYTVDYEFVEAIPRNRTERERVCENSQETIAGRRWIGVAL